MEKKEIYSSKYKQTPGKANTWELPSRFLSQG